jgi:hypothetical protein
LIKLKFREYTVQVVVNYLTRSRKVSRRLPYGHAVRRLVLTFVAGLPLSAASQPVSYGNDVVPIFAMHCYGCHTSDRDWWPPGLPANLDLSNPASFARVLAPGYPDESLLILRIEGKIRLRMPFLGAPLSPDNVNTLRRWIAEGAETQSTGKLPSAVLEVQDVAINNQRITVHCRVLTEAYLLLEVAGSSGKVLERRHAAVKWSRDYADATRPGGWVTWALHEKSPGNVRLHLSIFYAHNPYGTAFVVDYDGGGFPFTRSGMHVSDFLPNPVQPPGPGRMRFWLDLASDVKVEIVPAGKKSAFFQSNLYDLPKGLNTYRWDLRDQAGNVASTGPYTAVIRARPKAGMTAKQDVAGNNGGHPLAGPCQ